MVWRDLTSSAAQLVSVGQPIVSSLSAHRELEGRSLRTALLPIPF